MNLLYSSSANSGGGEFSVGGANELSIGDTYQGGMVFQINSDGTGLVVYISGWVTTSIRWCIIILWMLKTKIMVDLLIGIYHLLWIRIDVQTIGNGGQKVILQVLIKCI